MKSYYVENEENYIKGFASFMKMQDDDIFTNQEIRALFKDYMFDYFNIKVDLRVRFWRSIVIKALKQCGFTHIGFRG